MTEVSTLTDERIEELRIAAVTSKFDDTATALAELQELRARGGFKCPRCDVSSPHTHIPAAREATVRRLVETFRRSTSPANAWDAVDRLAAMAMEGS